MAIEVTTIPQLGGVQERSVAQADALVAVWDAKEACGQEAGVEAQQELALLGGATFEAMLMAQDIIRERRS